MAPVKLLLAWIAAIALAALEARLLPGPLRGVAVVDFFLLIAVYYGLRRGPVVGMVVGCATGILQDAATGAALGFHGVAKTIAGSFGSWLGGRLSLTAAVPQALILVIATVLDRTVRYVLAVLIGGSFAPVGIGVLLLQCAANALVGAAVFQALGRQDRGVLRRA